MRLDLVLIFFGIAGVGLAAYRVVRTERLRRRGVQEPFSSRIAVSLSVLGRFATAAGVASLSGALLVAGNAGTAGTAVGMLIGLSVACALIGLAAAALLYFLVPDYFHPMFVNPLGWVLLGLAAGLLAIGNLIIRRITQIA